MFRPVAALFSIALGLAVSGMAFAQDGPPLPGEVVAGDLAQPRGVSIGPEGQIILVEAGAGGTLTVAQTPEGDITGGMTQSVSSVAEDGTKTPVLLLPSLDAGREALSAYRAYWHEGSWWVVMSGSSPGQPPWQPLASTVLQVRPDGRIQMLIDLYAYEAANDPDGTGEINSNPGDVAWLSDGTMLITDSGANALYSWTAEAGLQLVQAWRTNPVPTSLAVTPADDVYVGFLGAGIAPGAGHIERWSNGELVETLTGLTAVTDIDLTADGALYAVQMFQFGDDPSTGPGPGSIVTVTAAGATPVVQGLPLAHSMAIADDGTIYVTVGTAALRGPMPGALLKIAPQ
jgi:hypothetical protein